MTEEVKNWLVDTLLSWADTFEDLTHEDGEDYMDAYYQIGNLAAKVEIKALTNNNRSLILFQLYQKFSNHSDEIDEVVLKWQDGGEVSKEEFEQEIVKIYNLVKDL